MARVVCGLLLLILVVGVYSGRYDELTRQEDGALARRKPNIDKDIREFELAHPLDAFMEVQVPSGLTDRLLRVPVQQQYHECDVKLLDDDLPKPDFFVIGMEMPSSLEIFNLLGRWEWKWRI